MLDYNDLISPKSPAIDRGLDLGYEKDFVGTPIPQNDRTDIGAFELKSTQTVIALNKSKTTYQ